MMPIDCGFGITFGDESERFVVSHQVSIACGELARTCSAVDELSAHFVKFKPPNLPLLTRQNFGQTEPVSPLSCVRDLNKCA